MFKIIAIETLEPDGEMQAILNKKERLQYRSNEWECLRRYLSIMKTLKYPQVYPLFNNYQISNKKVIKVECAAEEIYGQNPAISISAIVAENGAGKSSLIELLLRIVYNCASALQEGFFLLDGETPQKQYTFIPNIYARLYFEQDDGIIAYIEQNGNILTYGTCANGDYQILYKHPYKRNLKADCISIIEKLFYTITVNYSAYAFNEFDYADEWDIRKLPYDTQGNQLRPLCWLSSVFEKNDAYQMPLLLAPYRNNGQVKVSKEKNLLADRLYYLLLGSNRTMNLLFREKEAKYLNIKPDEVLSFKNNRKVSKKFDEICERLANEGFQKKKLDSTYKATLYGSIINDWKRAYGILNLNLSNNPYEQVALQYIAYKTIKIALNYADYKKFLPDLKELQTQNLVDSLMSNESHLTIKIRRCLALLIFGFPHDAIIELQDGSYRIQLNDYCNWIKETIASQKEKIEDIKCPNKKDWKEEELWPAPCFKVEIEFAANDKNGIERIFRHSSLSSGEKQIINIVTLILYHIKNIQSTHWRGETDMVTYGDILLIFDELELYFHPKYQQMLVNYLFHAIRALNIGNEIKGIHIILATHSPFILSDIPSNNVLCLENGDVRQPKDMLGETFAANIYDILSNKFFLESFVGEFATNIIKDIVDKLNKKKVSKQVIKEAKSLVSLIGDKVLQYHINQLIDLAEEQNEKDTNK